jgi:hypothetical protein
MGDVEPMNLRPSVIAARSTRKPPAAGSTTRSPGFVTAPIKRPSPRKRRNSLMDSRYDWPAL